MEDAARSKHALIILVRKSIIKFKPNIWSKIKKGHLQGSDALVLVAFLVLKYEVINFLKVAKI